MKDYKKTPEKKKNEKEKGEKKKLEKKDIVRELVEDVVLALIVLIAVFVVKNFLLINAVIPSGSMKNTIMIGDRIFGNRLAYQFQEPERGDIVIFKFPDNEKEIYIKRLIGLPGDEIIIRGGLVYLNGSEEPLDEPYILGPPSGDFGPYVVPEDCYFMMGDNRNNSNDSRFWEQSFVTEDEILAKAFLRYYPLHKIGPVK